MPGRAGKSTGGKGRGASLSTLSAAVLTAALVGLAGCAKHTEPVVNEEAMRVGDPEFARMWDAAKDVLRDYRFEVERQDRRAGIITTERLLARHGAEFWRKDAVTRRDVAEGILQTVYRSATVEIASADGGYRPRVRVEVERSDRPTLQVTSTSEAFALFRLPGDAERSRYTVGYEGDDEPEEPGAYLVSLGRDEALERELTAQILSAAGEKK